MVGQSLLSGEVGSRAAKTTSKKGKGKEVAPTATGSAMDAMTATLADVRLQVRLLLPPLFARIDPNLRAPTSVASRTESANSLASRPRTSVRASSKPTKPSRPTPSAVSPMSPSPSSRPTPDPSSVGSQESCERSRRRRRRRWPWDRGRNRGIC